MFLAVVVDVLKGRNTNQQSLGQTVFGGVFAKEHFLGNFGLDRTGQRERTIDAVGVSIVLGTIPLFGGWGSANWMMPRGDRPFTEREKRRFTRHPWLAKLYRWWIWAKLDLRYPLVFHSDSWAGRRMAQLAEQEIRAAIPDPELQAALIPDYPVGARRILISDDYYPALAREDVEVVTSPIARVTADGIETADGRSHGLDAIVLATGFESTRFLSPIEIQGLDGRSLAAACGEIKNSTTAAARPNRICSTRLPDIIFSIIDRDSMSPHP